MVLRMQAFAVYIGTICMTLNSCKFINHSEKEGQIHVKCRKDRRSTVAIIKNARSNKLGKKDILKVECDIDMLDLDVLAFIDHNITVNVIKDGKIVSKKELQLPKEIRNVIHCKNPRCITSIEQGLPHVFVLADEEKEIYRCKYCEEKYDGEIR